MTEPLEIKGYWWFPSSPDNIVAGILTYTPDKSIKLELIGQLKPNVSAVEEYLNRTDEDVILGFSSDAKEITLFNCFPAGGSLNFSCKFPIQRYNCQHMVIGIHILSLDTACFFKVQINIPYLSLWATPNSIKNSILYKEDEIEEYTISFNAEKNIIDSTEIDGYKFSLMGTVNYKGEYFEPYIQQKTIVHVINGSGFSLSDILKRIFLFEQFLSLATLKPLESSKIILYDKSKFQQLSKDKKHYFPIEYIRVFHGNDYLTHEKNLHTQRDFLFTYNTIKSEFKQILTKWYSEQEDIAPIRHHLIECIRKKGTFSSVDFLIVIQAVEGFWWRFRDDEYKQKNNIGRKVQTKLNTILKELIREFSDITRLKLNEINVDEVVDSRHYYSHFVHKKTKPYAKDGLELYNLTNKIRRILICCVLNFVGFTNNQIDNIVKQSNSSFLCD